MGKQILFKLIFIAAINLFTSASALVPEYQASYKSILQAESFSLLQQCSTPMLGTMQCRTKSKYALGGSSSVTVPTGFRSSIGTRVMIELDFSGTDQGFSLVIDGVAHPLSDGVTTQSFPLPNGFNTEVDLYFSSDEVGELEWWDDTKATIKKVTLVADNSELLQSVLVRVGPQTSKVKASLDYYQLQKKYFKFADKTASEIRELKTLLTGRQQDDLSDNCSENGSGEPDLLMPEQCQYLIVFNAILRGTQTQYTPEQLATAFQSLTQNTQELGKILEFLVTAAIDYSESAQETYNQALSAITE